MNNIRTPETELPFQLSPPVGDISNSAFLCALFDGIEPDAVVWLTSFDGDPGNTGPGDWIGYGVGLSAIGLSGIDKMGEAGANTFFTISSFRGALDEATGHRFGAARRKALHVATHVVVVDDIGYGPGAKIPPSKLPPVEPSYIVETSPDNWQVGYALQPAVEDAVLVAKFLDALVAEGLQEAQDPGMKGVTRNVRLPVGRNGKPKYTVRGESPHHRLLHWKPSTRYQLEDLAGGFGLDLGSISVDLGGLNGGPSYLTESTDPWIPVLQATGVRMERPNDKGPDGVWIDISCLWQDEHTGREDNGSAYCIGGGYQCHHGHCTDRTWMDARATLLSWDRDDGTVKQLALNVLAGEWFDCWWMYEGPPIEVRPPEQPGVAPSSAVPVKGLDAIVADIDRSLTIAVDEKNTQAIRGTLRDVDAALAAKRIDVVDIDGILDKIHDKTKRKQAVLKKLLGEFTAARKNEEAVQRRTKAAEREAVRVASGDRGARPHVVMLPGELDANEEGAPRGNTNNVERILQKMGATVRWNEMRLREEATGPLEGYGGDSVVQIIRDIMEGNDILRNQGNVPNMLRVPALENAYHPMKDYLLRVRAEGGWDHQDRLSDLLDTIKVSDEVGKRQVVTRRGETITVLQLTRRIVTRWLYSVVAAALRAYAGMPGNQPRGVLVFVGRQSTGKTTWIARLFDNLFPESHLCVLCGAHFDGSVDSKVNLLSSLVTELGEIDSTMKRAEDGMLKAFLSSDTDRVRLPYARAPIDIERRTVFAGTVNNTEYLKDPSGSSRFWSVQIKSMDLDAQRGIDMRQVWAQLHEECEAGIAEWRETRRAGGFTPLPWHMTKDEREWIEANNREHQVRTVPEQLLFDYYDWESPEWTEGGDARTKDTLLNINPKTLSSIVWECTGQKSIRNLAEWKNALRKLSGFDSPLNTERTVTPDNGEAAQVRKGRLWALPPSRRPSSGSAVHAFGSGPHPGEPQTENPSGHPTGSSKKPH